MVFEELADSEVPSAEIRLDFERFSVVLERLFDLSFLDEDFADRDMGCRRIRAQLDGSTQR